MQIQDQIRFTTNISRYLMDFLNQEATSQKVPKRNILEDALKMYRKKKLEQNIIASYNQMAADKEEMDTWLEIANNPENLKL